MSFHDVRFPEEISYGSVGGPGWSTNIIRTDSGNETRIGRWSQPRYKYNVAESIKTIQQLYTLIQFYIARQGPLHSFKYKDWLDFTSAADGTSAPANDDVSLGLGDASTTAFQIIKKYTSGGTTIDRTITKIVDGTLVAALNGSPTSSFVYDGTTGIITFNSAPASGASITVGFEFDVHVRFGEEIDENLSISYDTFETGSIQNVPLVEVVNETPVDENYYHGGAIQYSGSTTKQLTATEARVITLNPNVNNWEVRLPDETDLPLGGAYFYIYNIHGTNNVALKDSTGTAVGTLGPLRCAMVVLALDASDNKLWVAADGSAN